IDAILTAVLPAFPSPLIHLISQYCDLEDGNLTSRAPIDAILTAVLPAFPSPLIPLISQYCDLEDWKIGAIAAQYIFEEIVQSFPKQLAADQLQQWQKSNPLLRTIIHQTLHLYRPLEAGFIKRSF